MERMRQGTGGAKAGRPALSIVRPVLRIALWTLPVLTLRAMFAPRPQPLSGLSDSSLADIGLTRDDVTRPHERTASAELEMQRSSRGRDWR